jgi:hypothetical protein
VWLNLKEGAQQLDEKSKSKLLANYASVDAKRRARRLARMKGTVRQLYQAGNIRAGDQLMDNYLSQPTYEEMDTSDSDSSRDPDVELDPAPNYAGNPVMESIADAYDTAMLLPVIRNIFYEEPLNQKHAEKNIKNETNINEHNKNYKQLTLNLLPSKANELSAKATARLTKSAWSLANTVPTDI